MSFYMVGSVASNVRKVYDAVTQKVTERIRDEAAKGAAPAAKKSITPYVVGAIALSTLSLVVALRK